MDQYVHPMCHIWHTTAQNTHSHWQCCHVKFHNVLQDTACTHPHGMYIRAWSLLCHPVQKEEGVQSLHNFMEDPVHIAQIIYVNVNVWNHTWCHCDFIYIPTGHNGSINTYAVYFFAKKTRGIYLHLTGQTLKNKLHIRTEQF